jgi:hypothetical protein
LYLVSAAGDDGSGRRIGCPAYQCRASHLSRGALAHLVGEGQEGASMFERLERFRAEKAGFIRRVSSSPDEEEDEENYGEDDKAGTMLDYSFNTVSRFCPDPQCNKLLRAIKLGSDPVMLLCECGGAVCSACGAEDGHLGLSCEEKARYAKKVW